MCVWISTHEVTRVLANLSVARQVVVQIRARKHLATEADLEVTREGTPSRWRDLTLLHPMDVATGPAAARFLLCAQSPGYACADERHASWTRTHQHEAYFGSY
jgi:hypothetical protein